MLRNGSSSFHNTRTRVKINKSINIKKIDITITEIDSIFKNNFYLYVYTYVGRKKILKMQF